MPHNNQYNIDIIYVVHKKKKKKKEDILTGGKKSGSLSRILAKK
jgi:hypothetical protein